SRLPLKLYETPASPYAYSSVAAVVASSYCYGDQPVIRMFAGAASEYRDISGSAALTSEQLLASVAFKSRLHGSQNPRAMLSRAPKSATTCSKLHCSRHQFAFCAPVATGAAAVVMATESWWSNRRLPVTELVDQELVSDFSDTFSDTNSGGYSSLCGLTQARVASSRIYHRQRLNPKEQLALVELHDCFASNELMLYEALGLADKGFRPAVLQFRWIDSLNGDGSLYLTGRQVVNPSGGLMSKGHPLGASGVAQCAEMSWQHRGLAGRRQVPALDETDSNTPSAVVAIATAGRVLTAAAERCRPHGNRKYLAIMPAVSGWQMLLMYLIVAACVLLAYGLGCLGFSATHYPTRLATPPQAPGPTLLLAVLCSTSGECECARLTQ
uniref:propanoyl-CoA C-acyltransferase n=1 Tax=Macrostomum lignano TaxID=282301 RepID=A0A1I8FP44_9PLAT